LATIWWEVLLSGRGLMMAGRRQRIDAGRRRKLAEFLHDLPLAIDPETTVQLWGPTQSLAERFRLTAYDAIYLELAQRKQLALASLDQDLCSAATTVGVPVLGSRGVRRWWRFGAPNGVARRCRWRWPSDLSAKVEL